MQAASAHAPTISGTSASVNLTHIKYTLIDPVTVLDESEKWEKIGNDLFLKR